MALEAGDFGQWGSLSFELPDVLSDVREGVNTAADFIVGVMNVLLAVMELVKAFSVGLVDPITSVVQALLAEIRALIQDLDQLGLYFAGDLGAMLDPPFDAIRGGFKAYERRMIGRLTDTSDPTRPDLSSATKVYAAFFYQSVDVTGIETLINFIHGLAKFLRQEVPVPQTLPIPRPQEVQYGIGGTDALQWRGLDEAEISGVPANSARVNWTLTQRAGSNPLNPWPTPPAGGFLVTVSTVRDGLDLVWDRPREGSSKAENKNGELVQIRDYGPVLDFQGQPIKLYGGADRVFAPVQEAINLIDHNGALDGSGNLKDGRSRVYGVLDPAKPAPIPLNLLQDGDTYYLQRTFYVDSSSTVAQWRGDVFSIDLDLADMPNKASFEVGSDGQIEVEDLGKSDVYYVRVASLSEEVADNEAALLDFFDLSKRIAANKPVLLNLIEGAQVGADVSAFSPVVEITYPNDQTSTFLKALQAALFVLYLARPDLPVVAEEESLSEEVKQAAQDGITLFPNTALNSTGLEPYADLLGLMFDDLNEAYAGTELNPVAFRRDLKLRIKRLALEMYRSIGPNKTVEGYLNDQTTTLLNVPVAQVMALSSDPFIQALSEFGIFSQTFLELLEDTSDTDSGVSCNPWCIGVPTDQIERLVQLPNTVFGRSPQFGEVSAGAEDAKTLLDADGTLAEDIIVKTRGAQKILEKSIDEDGNLDLTPEVRDYLEQVLGPKRGSADRSPVFYVKASTLKDAVAVPDQKLAGEDTPKVNLGIPGESVVPVPAVANTLSKRGGMCFARTVVALDPQLISEVSFVLGYASSAVSRPSKDGRWLAFRFFDMLPPLEDASIAIDRWLNALAASLVSASDAIENYINFLEARIVETQQLIRRINALLQSVFLFQVPQAAGLVLSSNGTDGLLSDFVTADNKPSDSVFSYGAGIVLVGAPAVLLDLFLSFTEGDPSTNTDPGFTETEDLFNELPTDTGEAPDPSDPPEVL